jgi:hypothetical protein
MLNVQFSPIRPVLRTGALILFLSTIGFTQAEDKSKLDMIATLGSRNTIEDTCSGGGQFMGGGAVRFHIGPRFSVGPEVLFAQKCGRQTFTFFHPQLSTMAQLVYDLNQRRVRPYLIGGFGVVRHRVFGGAAGYRGEVSGGVGVKFFLSDRTFIAPELQAGGPAAFARISGSVGFVLK